MKKTRLGYILEKSLTKAGTFVGKHKALYYILNFTWGLFANIIGGLVFLCLLPWRLPIKKNIFLGAIENDLLLYTHKAGNKRYYWGFSFGVFFFTCMAASTGKPLKAHEVGHTCQNAILGPFQLFAIEIPSAIRYWYRIGLERRGKTLQTNYDDIWFEGSATKIGKNLML